MPHTVTKFLPDIREDARCDLLSSMLRGDRRQPGPARQGWVARRRGADERARGAEHERLGPASPTPATTRRASRIGGGRERAQEYIDFDDDVTDVKLSHVLPTSGDAEDLISK